MNGKSACITPEDVKQYFNIDRFFDNQEEIITAVLSGRDVLAVLPTGGGKSLCYQYPAMKFTGMTVVVTPLIALMSEQVKALKKLGIAAEYISSSQSYNEKNEVYSKLESGTLKLLYISPEGLNSQRFMAITECLDVSFVAVDEAHCISMWGYGFRPGYLAIGNFLERLATRPVVAAFTATASVPVKNDIKQLLGLGDSLCEVNGDITRHNLTLSIVQPRSKFNNLRRILSRNINGSVIVYCSWTESVDKLHLWLNEKGFLAEKYHGKMDDGEREKSSQRFMSGQSRVMIATSAFGMGIDKRDVYYIVHYEMPRDFESYYQEIGRAGRDGEKSSCVLFFSEKDLERHMSEASAEKDMRHLSKETRAFLKKLAGNRFEVMKRYIISQDRDDVSLKRFISAYFSDNSLTELCEEKNRYQDELIASINTVNQLYINVSMVANEIRKGNYTPGVNKTVCVSRREDKKLTVTFRLSEKLSYFDMMVADAVYTLLINGKKDIRAKTIVRLLSGDATCTLKPDRKKEIDESLKKLTQTQFFLDNTNGFSNTVFEDGKEVKIYEGKFLPISGKHFDKSPLYKYSEHIGWRFFGIPTSELFIGNKGEKAMPDSIENLCLKFYFAWRIKLSSPHEGQSAKSFDVKFTGNGESRKGLFDMLGIEMPGDKYSASRKKKTLYKKIERILESRKLGWEYIYEKCGSKEKISGIRMYLQNNKLF